VVSFVSYAFIRDWPRTLDSYALFLRLAASPGRRGLAYGHHGDVELERHPCEGVIGIDDHVAALLVDLGDHHVLDALAVLAMRENAHPGFDLVAAAKRLGGHPLLQRLVALTVSILGRQGHHEVLALRLALEGSFESGQQPPAAVQILQRLVAPDRRANVTD